MKFTLATVVLCVAASAAAFPAPGEEDAKRQEKRGVLGLGLGLPSYSSLSFAHAPIALPALHAAPAIHAAPIALPALHAAPAAIALPAPAIHAAPIALSAPAIHAPIIAAPAIKTIAAPVALPSLSLGKYW